MIIFLHGPDTFRSRRIMEEMKTKFISQESENNNSLDSIDGDILDISSIAKKLSTSSLFSQKRMVLVENIFKNKKTSIFAELLKYLKKIGKRDDLVLIFRDSKIEASKLSADAKKLFKFLCSQEYAQEFKILSPVALNNFIKKELDLYNKQITKGALTELLKRTEGDLWLISQSLKKASLGIESNVLDINAIKEYSSEKYNEDIFALTDAISQKNKAQAIKILEEQYEAGLSSQYLISMLSRQFKILLQIKEAKECSLNEAEATKQLKLHPYVVKKGLSQVNNFSLLNLKQYFNKIIEIDKKNKSEQVDIKAELLLLIANL